MNFPSSFNLSDLDGTNGFVINGINSLDYSGSSVSGAGDVNADGIADIIISTLGTDPSGSSLAGESYVVFGNSSGFSDSFNLADLDGSNGFVINGVNAVRYAEGAVSSAGDINGDGIADIILGASSVYPDGGGGKSYVVFGNSSGFSDSFNLADLDGTNGFVINGIDANDGSGDSVSNAGDVNGDGIADIIIGARFADPYGNNTAGESYVVFGSSSGFSDSFNLANLDGTNGFVINGIDAGDRSGDSVSGAGDVNGDGIDDLIIGARFADPNGNDDAGESYVVFGNSSGFSESLNLADLDGSNGFVINGIDSDDRSGDSVSSAGDVNGDGIDDLIIGTTFADFYGNLRLGESYVVFGNSSGFSDSFNLADLDGTNGFVINGIDGNESFFTDETVSGAGDVNGDGIDDLIIGASSKGPNGYGGAGESYVVFGNSSGFSDSFNLADLDGSNGFVLNGIDFSDRSGDSVSSVGDVNGDGIADIIIGAPFASSGGESYVVFGVASATNTIDLSEDTESELTPQGSTVYRFLNLDTGVHLYTSSEGERQLLEDSLPNYISEGEAFVSVDSFTGSPEPQEVFRFLNQDTGTRLYTISNDEKEFVEDNLPHFSLETESFLGYSQAQVGTIPVYRFFNTQTGAHFYTPSEIEREFVINNLPNYQVEGIAYHMFPV